MVIIWASIKCSRTTTQYIHDKPTSLTWRHTLRCKLFCHPSPAPQVQAALDSSQSKLVWNWRNLILWTMPWSVNRGEWPWHRTQAPPPLLRQCASQHWVHHLRMVFIRMSACPYSPHCLDVLERMPDSHTNSEGSAPARPVLLIRTWAVLQGSTIGCCTRYRL
jgi:hypothetical protein